MLAKVDPWPSLAMYWQAFLQLNASRQVGVNGPQPITIGEIDAFCRLTNTTDQNERLDLLEIIQAMDSAFVEHAYKERE